MRLRVKRLPQQDMADAMRRLEQRTTTSIWHELLSFANRRVRGDTLFGITPWRTIWSLPLCLSLYCDVVAVREEMASHVSYVSVRHALCYATCGRTALLTSITVRGAALQAATTLRRTDMSCAVYIRVPLGTPHDRWTGLDAWQQHKCVVWQLR